MKKESWLTYRDIWIDFDEIVLLGVRAIVLSDVFECWFGGIDDH